MPIKRRSPDLSVTTMTGLQQQKAGAGFNTLLLLSASPMFAAKHLDLRRAQCSNGPTPWRNSQSHLRQVPILPEP
jgi:hypothetical protein